MLQIQTCNGAVLCAHQRQQHPQHGEGTAVVSGEVRPRVQVRLLVQPCTGCWEVRMFSTVYRLGLLWFMQCGFYSTQQSYLCKYTNATAYLSVRPSHFSIVLKQGTYRDAFNTVGQPSVSLVFWCQEWLMEGIRKLDTGLLNSEDRVPRCSVILTQYWCLTDGWTDGFALAHTALAKLCLAFCGML